MIKIESDSTKTDRSHAQRTWIGGVTYVPDDATAYAAHCERDGCTVTPDQTPPAGWSDLVDAFKAGDAPRLARIAASALL